MNFAFGLAISLAPLAFLLAASFLLIRFALKRLEMPDDERETYRKYNRYVHQGLALLVLALTLYTSGTTYGPRLEIQASGPQYHPETQEIQGGKAFTETPEWRGTFDEKLESEDPRKGGE